MITDISSEDFREQFASGARGEYLLIDVREEEEHAEFHIPGTINIPLSELLARLDEISDELPVALVCNTGVRSEQAALLLAGMGYDQDSLFNLEDGAKGWRKKGYPIETGASK